MVGVPSKTIRPVGLTAGTVLTLLVLAGFYYFRTESYADYLRQRNLRQLARMSSSIEDTINNTESIILNLEKERERKKDDHVAAPLLAEERERRRRDEDVAAQLSLVPSLRIRAREVETASAAEGGSVKLDVEHHTGSLIFSYTSWAVSASYELDLAQAVLPLLESRFFDKVFLADAGGHVLLQAGAPAIRLREIPPPPKDEDGIPVAEAGERFASTARDAELAGGDYKLFLHPIHLKIVTVESKGHDDANYSNEWTVGGLVDSASFRNESVALDPTELLLLAVALALATLAWPFLKIWLMGPRERVAVRDVLFLGFSQVLISGVLSLCLMDVAYYPNLRDQLDEQLGSVGAQLGHKFERELDAALEELAALSAEFTRQDRGQRIRPNLQNRILENRQHSSYPLFDMVFWVDGAGDQVAKWSTGETVTPVIDVSRRRYFERVAEGRLWPRGERRFFIDTIRSATTGQALNAISTACPDPGTCKAAVMLTRFRTFERPVLPPGFSFAVLDQDGWVLFHSLPERSLEENFVTETDDHPGLRSLLVARESDHVTARYLGRDVRLVSWPLASTPLTLLVFADKAYLRTINLETMTLALTLFLAFCLVMLFQFAALSYFGFRRRMRWAWPDRKLPSKYVLSITILSLFMIELLVLFFIYPAHRLLPYAFLAPFQAIGLALAVLGIGLRGFEAMKRWCGILVGLATLGLVVAEVSVFRLLPLVAPALSLLAWRFYMHRNCLRSWRIPPVRRLYFTGSVASLIILGFLPGMLFFKVVHRDHLKSYIKYGQLTVAEGLHDRSSGRAPDRPVLPAELDRLDVTVEPFFNTCTRTDGETWSPCERLAAEPVKSGPARAGLSEQAVGVEPLLWRYLPFLTQQSVAMRRLFSSGAEDGAWSWSETGGRRLAGDTAAAPRSLHLRFGRAPEIEVRSWIPATLLYFDGFYLAGLAAAAVLILALAWYQGRRVFLLDFEPAEAVSSLPMADQPIDRNFLIICPQQCDRAKVLDRPEVHPVDLKQITSLPKVVKLAEAGRKRVVCFDHFGLRLADPSWNRALLEWLEKLAYVDDRTLVLFSGRDPDSAIAAALTDEPEGDRKPIRDRWTRLLAMFEKVAINPRSDSEEFREEVKKRFDLLRGSAALPQGVDRSRFDRRLDTLERRLTGECAGRPPLEAAARTIIMRDDLDRISVNALLEQIREVAEGYYRLLWTNLSDDERLMVAQIADGALVNPHWRQPLRRLMAQGMVVRAPELRLFNHSFARFVREEVRPEDLVKTELAGARSTWTLIRQPLFFGLILVAVFLYATQRHVFQAGLGLVSALAISIPAVFKLMGFLRQPGAGGEGA